MGRRGREGVMEKREEKWEGEEKVERDGEKTKRMGEWRRGDK